MNTLAISLPGPFEVIVAVTSVLTLGILVGVLVFLLWPRKGS